MPTLVRTPKAFPTESLFGFVLRVCEHNGYDTPHFVWDLAAVSRGAEFAPRFPVDELARILGQPPEDLRRIAYRVTTEGRGTFKILNHPLGNDLRHGPLRLRKPALCPQCVADQGFIDAFWDLSAAVACPVHHCAVVRTCPTCARPLTWKRPALLTCQCGASLAAATTDPAGVELGELMAIIRARLHDRPIDADRNSAGYPVQYLSSMPFSALIRMLTALGLQALKSRGVGVEPNGATVNEAVAILRDWPQGYHRFLTTLGDKSLTERPGAMGLRKQFRGFYQAMFKNREFSAQSTWLREEFLRFGQHHWGQAVVDRKFFGGRAASDPGRFLPVNEVARRFRIWKPMRDRMIADGTLVTRRIRSGKSSRVVVDLEKSRLPQESSGTMSVREAAARVGLPVSVLRHLRAAGILSTGLRRGHVTSWHVDDIETFRTRALALPVVDGSGATQELVLLRDLMRRRLRDAKAKTEIAAAVFEGRLLLYGRCGDQPGDMLVDRAEADAFIVQTRRKVEGDSYSLPESAALTGLCESAVANAIQLGLLAAEDRDGRTRVSAQSVERFRMEYIPLALLAKKLGNSPRGLLRLCREAGLPTVRVARVGCPSPQPLLRRAAEGELVELWNRSKARSTPEERVDVATRSEASLRQYLEGLVASGKQLPRIGGKPNRFAIARACGFYRNVLYLHPSVAQILEEFDEQERRRTGIGEQNPLKRLRMYLDGLRRNDDRLPLWKGRPNKLAIAKACGIGREVFYTDPQALKLINEYAKREYPDRHSCIEGALQLSG